ncbi:hypothetical protein EN866_33820 [Mesorhizobium sp. M2D.F.Ca.ET.223.01.1.1]|uniref:hypothetical protein n=1 Tax=Mesorhizobium sp. M2D.F.Ca.ET.223.01.1.1 TaxID=2563940 RepID=UPI0010924933|nr:hypothetical protein [Mesorhizobium sp. M2D.F.Ca.ET.223.01.1.1]TGR83606.1 hypothetical protein EN866_33820 [Mesorhizobium sp. M2D.F.Ca.ET.223.01.1.1]TGT74570.1 hypothetical protein EN802_12045 [bacterium M00.F.Ca.ET.159.01.1.1]TGT86820.1 hypothetical protein EN800_08935 [bacterium M00.F.Ca.ET.157.01.1.1]
MKPLISMREALADPELFGTILAGDSWLPWRVLLVAMMGEPLTADERIIFTALTQREHEPLQPIEEFWGIVGRRAGKTRSMSVLSAYLAALCDWSDVLVRGEIGKLIYAAYNQKQASIAFSYAKSIFELPLFAQQVESVSADIIELKTNVELEVRAATWRGLRSVTSIGAIFDELAFFQSEEHSANTDREILAAVRPSLATTSGPLIAISSPFAKMGEVYQAVERDFGPNGDPLILVARGASRDFNPSLSPRVVQRALERDAAAARAEYLGEFREDLAAFVDLAIVQACVAAGMAAILPNRLSQPYTAFCDPAGGSGTDSMTLAIGHDGLDDLQISKDLIILDRIDEVKPPFKPETVVRQFAETLKSYGCNSVHGDGYAAAWVVDAFDRYDIRYIRSPLNKSELFLNFLPMLNSRSIQLLDHGKLVSQLTGMQRRVTGGGREVIDHNQNSHDDVANSVAGCLAMIGRNRRQTVTKTTVIPV